MLQRLRYYLQLIRFDKPIGTLLLLWPTLWAVWIAGYGRPSPKIIIIFCLGVFCMRSAGDAINDFADRHVDGAVARTKNRPLARGVIKPWEALVVFVFFILCGFILVLQLNRFTLYLAFIAVLLAVIYPFCKRFTYLPQVVLGCAYSFGIPMAFTAQQSAIPLVSVMLYVAAVSWTVAYDTIYAMVDRQDDKKVGIKSTAILFGRADKLIIGLLQLIFLILMLGVGLEVNASIFYYLGLFCALLLMGYQQLMIRWRKPECCFRAFLHNNWVGLVIFLGLLIHYQLN